MARQSASFVNVINILFASLVWSSFSDSDLLSHVIAAGESSVSPVRLEIEVGPSICIGFGHWLNASCSLTTPDVNTYLAVWSLRWIADFERPFKHVASTRNSSKLTSRLTVRVTWHDQKTFACVASMSSGTKSVVKILNKSLMVRVKPRPVKIVGLRYIETPSHGRVIEAFWKPAGKTSLNYTLEHCVRTDLYNQCISVNKIKCQFSQKDYYLVANTSGKICVASIESVENGFKHDAYIVSHHAGCETKGLERQFSLVDFSSKIPSDNILVLIPKPVVNIRVMVTQERAVRLTWKEGTRISYESYRKYVIYYNCSVNRTIWLKNADKKTAITLYETDFHPYRPYTLCQFCVRTTIHDKRLFSEPVCNTTRLAEDIPSRAPTITCSGDSCNTTNNDVQRNVTITWDLPPHETWNGVLRNVSVVYHRDTDYARVNEVFESNLTKRATLLKGLDNNSTYVVRMTACNKLGCSIRGKPVPIFRVNLVTSSQLATGPPKQESESFMVTVWVPVTIVVLFFFLFSVCAALRLGRKRRNARRGSLPSIKEPIDYDNVAAFGQTYSEYNVVKVAGKGEQEASLDILAKNENSNVSDPQVA